MELNKEPQNKETQNTDWYCINRHWLTLILITHIGLWTANTLTFTVMLGVEKGVYLSNLFDTYSSSNGTQLARSLTILTFSSLSVSVTLVVRVAVCFLWSRGHQRLFAKPKPVTAAFFSLLFWLTSSTLCTSCSIEQASTCHYTSCMIAALTNLFFMCCVLSVICIPMRMHIWFCGTLITINAISLIAGVILGGLFSAHNCAQAMECVVMWTTFASECYTSRVMYQHYKQKKKPTTSQHTQHTLSFVGLI